MDARDEAETDPVRDKAGRRRTIVFDIEGDLLWTFGSRQQFDIYGSRIIIPEAGLEKELPNIML